MKQVELRGPDVAVGRHLGLVAGQVVPHGIVVEWLLGRCARYDLRVLQFSSI